ncbi:pimeloyl-CoA dehydrogenase small subunit [Aestuariicella hydrocarbonica]|uniref:Pimeloyl-CoA dehydrogenase small subunit n=1 Tax=Pseudomaricurvus hydrocarbonicus TaxID=1470433 RepID=A0A9E5MFZ2_9GAMM|nr:acyl-CoA dehydrogenase family protein [Aestuariicella hydrocarbonica]NHO64026.1 pimeloyl-CoA dehydrogenase small subunit [Aestuariicella hydrocarbonica]
MDFSYSEEQQMLQDSIAKFVQNDYDFDSRMKLVKSDLGYSEANWKLFAELGWLMVPFSEADGGLGGSAADLMVVMEEFGKGIVIEPFLATTVLGGGLVAAVGNDTQKAELIGGIMEGNLQMAFAYAEPQSRYNLADVATTATKDGDSYRLSGHKAVVLNGAAADVIAVSARTSGSQMDAEGISLFLVDPKSDGVRLKTYRTQDGGRAAEVHLDNVTVSADQLLGAEGQALPVMNQVLNRAILSICSEAVGAMEVSYKKTVEYTKTRVQFGVPIAKFQALQHRMADMFIEHQQAKSIVLMAAMKLDQGGAEADKAVSAMKSRIGKAARKIGQESIQIHGGIGVTEELDVGHYFKRLTMIELLFGNGDFHTQRFAKL